MAPIQDAIVAINSASPGEDVLYRKITSCFNIQESTLRRRHQGKTRSRAHKAQLQQALNSQQEPELVQYIEGLSERGLPLTREMVRNFGSAVAQEEVSEAWVSRFLKQNNTHLTSKWATEMDCNRHVADFEESYRRYFELLHSKMRQYDVEAENVYNMNEKGFFVSITGRSKRVFSKAAWQHNEKTQALQDGSREWITVIAAVCADGKTLPLHSSSKKPRDFKAPG
jgi:hypothetical protein